jgi:hypothetical protein
MLPVFLQKLFPTYYLFSPLLKLSEGSFEFSADSWELIVLILLLISLQLLLVSVINRKEEMEMCKIERKKTEAEIENLKDDELDTVTGGFLGIILFDQCSTENPERYYNYSLCSDCPMHELRRNQYYKTQHYCGKIQKVIKTEQ